MWRMWFLKKTVPRASNGGSYNVVADSRTLTHTYTGTSESTVRNSSVLGRTTNEADIAVEWCVDVCNWHWIGLSDEFRYSTLPVGSWADWLVGCPQSHSYNLVWTGGPVTTWGSNVGFPPTFRPKQAMSWLQTHELWLLWPLIRHVTIMTYNWPFQLKR